MAKNGLLSSDYASLERCYITGALVERARISRVNSLDGASRMGRKPNADYSGLLIPYIDPESQKVVAERLRVDHPPLDPAGKPAYKYLSPPGQRSHLYFPFARTEWLQDETLPVVITEGEKKGIALHRAALEAAPASSKPLFLAIAIAGVWCWRGVVAQAPSSNGLRGPVHGPIPDLDRIAWKNRKALIAFDANVGSNPSVRAARAQLAREIESRGGLVYFLELAPAPGINGVDDFLAQQGLTAFLGLYHSARRHDWHRELTTNDKGRIEATVENALTALRLAPEMRPLGFNEFAQRIEALSPMPWPGEPGPWANHHDTLLAAWLESQGVRVSEVRAARAADAAARERPFHPVKEYLSRLVWDGIGRIDDWLTLYAHAEASDYTRAVGARWLISAIARVCRPGCQADHTLILEGPQGVGKSTLFRILGGEFYTDDIPELGTKDAQLSVAGIWIGELAELDAMNRAEISKVKRFLSETQDHFRPPYERRPAWFKRSCVFCGSVNYSEYLKDDTGGRRFWPVKCGARIDTAAFERDRDQLWAEAYARYHQGAKWWFDADLLIEAAAEEQHKRFQQDPWQELVERWLLTQTEVTVAETLESAVHKRPADFERADQTRMGYILRRAGWRVSKRPRGGARRRVYELFDPARGADFE